MSTVKEIRHTLCLWILLPPHAQIPSYAPALSSYASESMECTLLAGGPIIVLTTTMHTM